jgi:hypothetical protein
MSDQLHGWGPALEEIARRKAEAFAMGGEARLERQQQRGRLNARERLNRLFDRDTFFEIGNLVGTVDEPPVPGDTLVAGSGRIRPDQRSTGTRRGRGRDRARRLDRKWRLRQALPPVPAGPAGAGSAGHDAGGRRAPGQRDGWRETTR